MDIAYSSIGARARKRESGGVWFKKERFVTVEYLREFLWLIDEIFIQHVDIYMYVQID